MTRRIGSGDRRHAAVVVVTTALLLGAALSGATVGVVDADSPSVGVTDGAGGSAVEAPSGETVTVTVGANASNVSAYQANLTFDPDVVRVVSVSGTDDFDDAVANVDNESGWVAFNQYASSNISDPQLATITVEVVGDAGNETTLAFVESDTKLSDDTAQELGVEQYDGLTVTVESESENSGDDGSDGGDGDGSGDDGGDGDDSDDGDDGGDGSDSGDGGGDDGGDGSDGDDRDDDGSDGGDGGDNDDSDGGSSGGGSSSAGSGDAGESEGVSDGPPRVASDTASANGDGSIATTLGGSSPTVERVELRFGSPASGEYVVTEFEQLPTDIADDRDDADDIVTVLEFTAPDGAGDGAVEMVLTLNGSAVNASEGGVDSMRVERYDEETDQWESLGAAVDDSDRENVTLTATSPRLSWFVVTAGNRTQTDDAAGSADGANETSPGTDDSTNGTTDDSDSTSDAADDSDSTNGTTDDSDTTGASSSEGGGITVTEVPGFGVRSVLAGGVLLYGFLRFGRRER